MTKQSAYNQLETVMGKLDYLNYHTNGQLTKAMREVAYVRDRLMDGQIELRKIQKNKNEKANG